MVKIVSLIVCNKSANILPIADVVKMLLINRFPMFYQFISASLQNDTRNEGKQLGSQGL